ncbi:MAG: enoyl-CoA hydratase/isomerase family protein [Propionibacteriaceae bacterium]|nr:enoyl-CoA hydratase/isomerase family protein [Propionibacteriaceae bacterium]
MTRPILLSVDDGLARLTLNRPHRLNAFNAELAHAWTHAVAEVTSRDDVGAVLLSGNGPAFCAGGDVADMAATMSGGSEVAELARTINEGILALTRSNVPVAAALHGATAGGGLGIMLCSDYAVAGESARIGSKYASMGLTPDLSVTAQLVRAVGERRALQLVLTERLLSAQEALEWGLVAEVVPDDGVLARAEEVARSWLTGATGAYGAAKQLIRSSAERTFEEQVGVEARTIGEAFDTEDARARIAAFVEASRRRQAERG